jgi:hypothetical protein
MEVDSSSLLVVETCYGSNFGIGSTAASTLRKVHLHFTAIIHVICLENCGTRLRPVPTVEFQRIYEKLSDSSCMLPVVVSRSFSPSLSCPGGPKVYDVTKYLDDHPGGAEVMLDVGGQNADEFFEDIGHSKEAREELKKYYIGEFKLDEKALAAMKAAAEAKKNEGSGKGLILVLLVAIIAILFGVYQSQMK